MATLYMAWRGVDDDEDLWWAVSHDGKVWSRQLPLSDRASFNAPALAAYQNKLFMAWRGADATKTCGGQPTTEIEILSGPINILLRTEVPSKDLRSRCFKISSSWRGVAFRAIRICIGPPTTKVTRANGPINIP
jgi:hypothetical protein